jgi:murein L,D-transpeptidase YafK
MTAQNRRNAIKYFGGLIFFGVLALLMSSQILFAADVRQPVLEGVADSVLINKSARTLSLFSHVDLLLRYSVSLGKSAVGKKEFDGDGKTPEGNYVIDFHKFNSKYHRALHISYPNSADTAHAKALGKLAGGDIMIHGLPNAIGWIGKLRKPMDWTIGCVAVSNSEIEEIYAAVPDGTPVKIIP